MKRTADDRLYFSILGQKIELVYADGEWRPAAPDLFEQEEQQEQQAQEQEEQEEQQAQEQEEQEEQQAQAQEQEEQEEQQAQAQEEQEEQQAQAQEQEEQEKFRQNLVKGSKAFVYIENRKEKIVFSNETTSLSLQERFDYIVDYIGGRCIGTGIPINASALIGHDMYQFYPRLIGERYIIPVCRLSSKGMLPVGKIISADFSSDIGYYFETKSEQEQAQEQAQEESTPAPALVQEESTSPIYRYFETKEGSSIGVYRMGDDTIIGIADKAGNLWSWRNLGKQGKKRVKYTIFGDDQQLNSKELGSIHGAIIEARNFLQAAKKEKKPAKVEIKAAFLGQEPIKIAEIQLNNGTYELTVPTTEGEAIVPKTEPKEEEVPILAIDPVFNKKTEGISAKISQLRELKEQTALILEQLKAEGLSIEQIKALLGN